MIPNKNGNSYSNSLCKVYEIPDASEIKCVPDYEVPYSKMSKWYSPLFAKLKNCNRHSSSIYTGISLNTLRDHQQINLSTLSERNFENLYMYPNGENLNSIDLRPYSDTKCDLTLCTCIPFKGN